MSGQLCRHSPVWRPTLPFCSSDPSRLLLLPTNPSHVSPPGLYHAYRQGKGIFSDISKTYPPDTHHIMIHPNDRGHGFLAEMIVYALYRTLDQMFDYGEMKIMAPPSSTQSRRGLAGMNARSQSPSPPLLSPQASLRATWTCWPCPSPPRCTPSSRRSSWERGMT
jgi:hypothetical protein